MSQLPKKEDKRFEKGDAIMCRLQFSRHRKIWKNMIDCTKVEGLVGKLYLKCTY